MRVYGLILLILLSTVSSHAQQRDISYFNQILEVDTPGFTEFDVYAPVQDYNNASLNSCDKTIDSVKIYAYNVSNAYFYLGITTDEDFVFDIPFDQFIENPSVYPDIQVFVMAESHTRYLVFTLNYPFNMGNPDYFGLIVYYQAAQPGHMGLEVESLVQTSEGCPSSTTLTLPIMTFPFLLTVILLIASYRGSKKILAF